MAKAQKRIPVSITAAEARSNLGQIIRRTSRPVLQVSILRPGKPQTPEPETVP
jgi:hypothetical protein